jgi:hypothetical protein
MIKSRRIAWPGRQAQIGMKRNAYNVLGGKRYRKRPPGRPRHK